MVKNSTLVYLVDDMNQTSDIIFPISSHRTLCDDQLEFLLDMIEYDPGSGLVKETLQGAGIG